jgi:hypothetical protein
LPKLTTTELPARFVPVMVTGAGVDRSSELGDTEFTTGAGLTSTSSVNGALTAAKAGDVFTDITPYVPFTADGCTLKYRLQNPKEQLVLELLVVIRASELVPPVTVAAQLIEAGAWANPGKRNVASTQTLNCAPGGACKVRGALGVAHVASKILPLHSANTGLCSGSKVTFS